jgi:hypothetical protein
LQASARLPGQDTLEAMLDLYGMADLAGTVYAQGDLPGARKLEEQVLEARERLLGKEHPDTLMAMNNLAVTLYAQGELAGARKLQKQVLEGRRRLLGKAPRYPPGGDAEANRPIQNWSAIFGDYASIISALRKVPKQENTITIRFGPTVALPFRLMLASGHLLY